MPSTAVYLVLPASMAWIAASLTLAGVSKSGSPAPRPMTSRPAAFNARAFIVTAMVAEGLMRARRWARTDMIVTGAQELERADIDRSAGPFNACQPSLSRHARAE